MKLLLLSRDLCETRGKRETGVPCLPAAARPCLRQLPDPAGGSSCPVPTERDREGQRHSPGTGRPQVSSALAGDGAELWDRLPQGSLSLLTFDFPKGNFPQQSPAQLPHPAGLRHIPGQGLVCGCWPCPRILQQPRSGSAATCFVPGIIPTFRARLREQRWKMLLGQHRCSSSQRAGTGGGFGISHPTRMAVSAGSSFAKAPALPKARSSLVQRFAAAAGLCSARAGGFPCALELCPGAFP